MANPKENWKKCKPSEIIFIDIETASQFAEFDEMGETLRSLWLEKAETLHKNSVEKPVDSEFYFEKAALYAEFGRVVCISIGCLNGAGNELVIKSFADPDEAEILSEFAEFINIKLANRPYFCGHNIKEFDVPYLCRRMLANGVSLPSQLDVGGLKPWDVSHIDTMELWKFGDNKNYTKLKLILEVLGIQSPKDDIDGSQVTDVFWNENDLERIVKYCEKDVIAVTQLLLKFRGEPLVEEGKITIRDWLMK